MTQSPLYDKKDVRDVIKKMPTDYWLHHKDCKYALAIMCHRNNTEFTEKAKTSASSAITVAEQRKRKAERRTEERDAVKIRTEDNLRLRAAAARAPSPTKTMELQLREKWLDDTIKTGEVKRIEKMINLLEKHKDKMPAHVYDARINSLLDQMLKCQESVGGTVTGAAAANADGEADEADVGNDNNDGEDNDNEEGANEDDGDNVNIEQV